MQIEQLLDAASEGRALPALLPPAEAKAIRQSLGLSTSVVSAAIGCDGATLERWEGGVHKPRNFNQALRWRRILFAIQKRAAELDALRA